MAAFLPCHAADGPNNEIMAGVTKALEGTRPNIVLIIPDDISCHECYAGVTHTVKPTPISPPSGPAQWLFQQKQIPISH